MRAGIGHWKPKNRILARVALTATLAAVVLAGTASPALAGVSRLSHSGGADVQVTWTFSSATNLRLQFRLADTACNGKPAYAHVNIYRLYGQVIDTVTLYNDAGCGTVRSYDTGTFSVGERVINIRSCVDGDGAYSNIPMVCGNYQDNPYT